MPPSSTNPPQVQDPSESIQDETVSLDDSQPRSTPVVQIDRSSGRRGRRTAQRGSISSPTTTSASTPPSALKIQPLAGHRNIVVLVSVLVIGAVVVMGLALRVWSGADVAPSSDATTHIPVVEVQRVKPAQGYTIEQAYTGRVRARRSSRLGFERPGRLVAVHVDEGRYVKKGQPLAKLDTRRLEEDKKQLQAERQSAVAQLDELVAGPRRQSIAAAEAQLEAQRAEANRTAIRLRRIQSLRERNAATQDELDEAKAQTDAANHRAAAVQEELELLLEGTRPEQIRAQRARVDLIDAQLSAIEIDLDNAVIQAPYDGQIDRRFWDEGTMLSPETAVFEIVEIDRLELWIGVPVRHLNALQPLSNTHTPGEGDSVEKPTPVEIDGHSHRARLKSVLPQLDDTTGTATAVLAIDPDPSHPVLPGQVGRLRLTQPVVGDGFWLATDALVRSVNGLWACLTVVTTQDGYRTQRHPVEVLHTDGSRAYVRGALVQGDLVVISGVQRLVAGQTVELSNDSQPPQLPASPSTRGDDDDNGL